VDRTLTCRDCGQTFTFTAGEQSFYAERGYTDPQRCPSCRAARKAQRNEGGGGYGATGNGGGYGRPQRTMYPAVCSNCGKETEVPFEPTLDKPVYCRECFQERRAMSSYNRY
jgi:CxxC-x17-CxxC domain-containing protein